MILEFFNVVWIYFLSKCLLGFRIDTSFMPFSAIVRFIPFYYASFWCDKSTTFEFNCINTEYNLIIPFILDVQIVKEELRCD